MGEIKFAGLPRRKGPAPPQLLLTIGVPVIAAMAFPFIRCDADRACRFEARVARP